MDSGQFNILRSKTSSQFTVLPFWKLRYGLKIFNLRFSTDIHRFMTSRNRKTNKTKKVCLSVCLLVCSSWAVWFRRPNLPSVMYVCLSVGRMSFIDVLHLHNLHFSRQSSTRLFELGWFRRPNLPPLKSTLYIARDRRPWRLKQF